MFDIVITTLVISPQLKLIQKLCELEGLPFTVRSDQRLVMQTTKGQVSPETGFVILTKDGSALLDIYDVVHYIEERGLKRC